ncbi:methyl-accepting chemotaxis protein [Pseudomonas sp.]|uniref:methyl-accepting chemotaxis protein n=1 Tax=Pseudomonas sp. TaxID=306 RepID=UPI0026096DDB|nr:methyl-accepting chemotaxis protein [Pseudomonas sp.]
MKSYFINLGIGKRLLAGFGIVLVVALIAVGIGISRLSNVADASRVLLEDPLTTERLISDWYRVIHSGIRRSLAIVKSGDSSLATYFAGEVKQGTEEAGALQKQIEPHITAPQEKILWVELQQRRKDYLRFRDQAISLKKEGKLLEAEDLIEHKFVPAAQLYSQRIKDLQAEERAQINRMATDIQQVYIASRNLMLVLMTLLVVFVAVCAWFISLSITRPLAHAVQTARKVAAGDLSVRIENASKDEAGQLLRALQEMIGNLSQLVTGVRNSTATMGIAASEISSGNADLSRRTEMQASTLEETSSSMEELTRAVQQNDEHAQEANHLVMSASSVALQGRTVVNRVVSTMQDIKTSSAKVVEIIGVIDGIAFQTNILALNAAVEAARAGDQGRGFAVVATEVRSLAQRSATAAKEIKTLIDASVHQVGLGASYVDEAGKTMDKIVDSVKRAADIMGEISTSSREQSAGIAQINIAVTQMDQMTQENAALVEQAAAAAKSMEEQAQTLERDVSVFKLRSASTPLLPQRRYPPLLPA